MWVRGYLHSRIICENIAPEGGSTAFPAGKYEKFGSRGSSSHRSLAIFFPSSTGGMKKKNRVKIGNGSTFLLNERKLLIFYSYWNCCWPLSNFYEFSEMSLIEFKIFEDIVTFKFGPLNFTSFYVDSTVVLLRFHRRFRI